MQRTRNQRVQSRSRHVNLITIAPNTIAPSRGNDEARGHDYAKERKQDNRKRRRKTRKAPTVRPGTALMTLTHLQHRNPQMNINAPGTPLKRSEERGAAGRN